MNRILSTIMLAGLALTANAARIDTVQVNTTNLPAPMNVIVITPDKALDGTRVPTVYTLHGWSGKYTSWLAQDPALPQLADQHGVIMVFPDGQDTWYLDCPNKPEMKMESFFIQDLVPWIDNNYPTIPDASKRAIHGLSMGGHGSLYLAFRHPDVFKNAGSMSGGVDIRPFPVYWDLDKDLGSQEEYPQRWEDAAVINMVKDLKPGEINIIFDCGIEDVFTKVNENLHQEMLKYGIPHDYTSRPGGHTWEYWRNSILYHLLFFSENFK